MPIRRGAVALLCAAATALAGCGSTEAEGARIGAMHERARATAHTTRLPADTPQQQAIVIAQAVYPATREENGPGAVIVTRPDAAEAFTAMARVTHMPVNAPILYTEADGTLSEDTMAELRRLEPDGVAADGQVQVYVVGSAGREVVERIRDELYYKVRHVPADDPIELADRLDRWQAAMKADLPDEVFISAIDHPDGLMHGIGGMGWNAHMGHGFAWVTRDGIPKATRRILERRARLRTPAGETYLYLTGGPDVISDAVAVELSRYGMVRRIAGDTVYRSSTVNAGYKDYGRDWAWWWNWTSRSIGWGIAQSGHNFIIVSADDALGAVPAAVLGHMGKHGPILVVEPSRVPQPVVDYLRMVRPSATGPQYTVLNHAWVIGSPSTVADTVQDRVDALLSISPGPTHAVRETSP